MFCYTVIILIIIIILNLFLIINTQNLSLCESLNEIKGNENETNNTEVKTRHVRALCDAISSSQVKSGNDELDLIPDFDLTQIASGN